LPCHGTRSERGSRAGDRLDALTVFLGATALLELSILFDHDLDSGCEPAVPALRLHRGHVGCPRRRRAPAATKSLVFPASAGAAGVERRRSAMPEQRPVERQEHPSGEQGERPGEHRWAVAPRRPWKHGILSGAPLFLAGRRRLKKNASRGEHRPFHHHRRSSRTASAPTSRGLRGRRPYSSTTP